MRMAAREELGGIQERGMREKLDRREVRQSGNESQGQGWSYG
jgi:hypothetical protein